VKYLLDTNIIIELLFPLQHADEVKRLFEVVPTTQLACSDFTFHSACLFLARTNKFNVLEQLLDDLLKQPSISILQLSVYEIRDVIQVMKSFTLDFDDAYQYLVSEKHDLEIISFDSDFDRTLKKRKTPAQVLADRSRQ